MIHRDHIGETRMTVGVADGDIGGTVVVVRVDWHNTLGREAMNRRQHWCTHQSTVAQWRKVKMVVDQLEGLSLLENCRNMQTFPDLRIESGVFGVRPWTDANQPRACQRIRRGKQRDLDPTCYQAFRQQRHNTLPGAIVPRWHAPGNGRQHSNTHGAAFLYSYPRGGLRRS